MSISEQDLYTALGVSPRENISRENAGENTEDVAEPPEDLQSAGEKETGIAEPSVESADTPAAGESAVAHNGDAQTPEERRKNAAARREREDRERESTLRNTLENEVNEQIKALGFTDSGTGKPIETAAGLRKYNEDLQRSQIESALGVPATALEGMFANMPEVVKMRQLAEQLEQQRLAVERAEVDAEVGRQLAEIAKYNPAVKSLEDMAMLDRFDEVARYVREHNFNLFDAYKLAYGDSIAAAARETQVKEQARRSAATSHLKSNAVGSAPDRGTPEPTTKEIELYQAMMPGITMDKIREYTSRFNG